MNKKLIIEIIIIIIIIIIVIPICANASSNYNKSKEIIEKYNITVNITNNGSNKIIFLNNYNNTVTTINLVLKISKFSNDYIIKLDNNIYNLKTMEHTESEEYNYYNLGSYKPTKTRSFSFQLIQVSYNYEDNITYSFLAEPYK